MIDTGNTLFYKTRFSIKAVDESEDLLWKVILHVRRWIIGKYKKRAAIIPDKLNVWTKMKYGGRLSTANNSVVIETESMCSDEGNVMLWACKISETPIDDGKFALRKWNMELGFEYGEGNPAILSCVVSYSDTAGFIGPYQEAPEPNIPKVISYILNDNGIIAFKGQDTITDQPELLKVGDWPGFEKRIDNDNRRLPYIYISSRIINETTRETQIPLDPYQLAKIVCCNAAVFYSIDPDFSEEMKYMNPEYACYNGAVRVYFPGKTEAVSHRYLTYEYISDTGSMNVVRYLRKAFGQSKDYYYESYFGLEECRQRKREHERRIRLSELQERHKGELDETVGLADETIREEEEKRLTAEEGRLIAELEADDLREKLNEAKTEIFNLSTQVDRMRPAFEDNKRLQKALEARDEIKTVPSDPNGILSYFNTMFADRLALSEEAWKSLKYCTIPGDLLWKTMYALANTMFGLFRAGGGDIYKEFTRKTGIPCAFGEGKMTRRDKGLMRQFSIRYRDEDIDIEPHITFPGIGQSIHFGYSAKYRIIVIGSCGEHKEIYSSQKVK